MRFWSSSETHVSVGDNNRLIRNKIEAAINGKIKNKSYGDGLIEWAYLNIIDPPNFLPPEFFKEIKRYRKKKKEVEFRLKIDYDKFLKADDKGAARLICESILRSVDIAEKEFKIKDFDFEAFRKDLIDCFKENGWM